MLYWWATQVRWSVSICFSGGCRTKCGGACQSLETRSTPTGVRVRPYQLSLFRPHSLRLPIVRQLTWLHHVGFNSFLYSSKTQIRVMQWRTTYELNGTRHLTQFGLCKRNLKVRKCPFACYYLWDLDYKPWIWPKQSSWTKDYIHRMQHRIDPESNVCKM